MAAGGERGDIEGPERARCGFSYLAVIGIFPCPIALHEASLRSRLTRAASKKIYYILEHVLDDIPCTYLHIKPHWLKLSCGYSYTNW